MNKVYVVESSCNPKAFNKASGAIGLGQVTPIVLEEWNNLNRVQYVSTDLYNEKINRKISDWYMNVRIPNLLKHFRLEDTERNRLISYNAGIGYLVHDKPLPEETKEYLKNVSR